MYSEAAITKLSERIRWNKALDSDFPIELDETNLIGESGKHIQSFHQLASIDNIYAAVPKINMEAEEFNAVLTDIRMQATLQAMADILDKNNLYLPDTDYDAMIISNRSVFDTAIGFKAAISVLEFLISSKRINPEERNSKLAAGSLKIELEGLRSEQGVVVSKGIKYFYEKSVRSASRKLFPEPILIFGDQLW